MFKPVMAAALGAVCAYGAFAQSASTFYTPNLEVTRFPRTISLTQNEYNDDFCPSLDREVDEDDGYIMQREKTVNAQFSMLHTWWFGSVMPGPAVALTPIYDRYALFFGKADDAEERDYFKRKKLPVSLEEIEKWNVGDAVFWASQGGARLMAGAGWYVVNVGGSVVMQGGFSHYVEKVAEDKVFVSLEPRKLRTVSFIGSVAASYATIDNIFEKGRSRSYEVELVDQEHLNAYRKFLRGNDKELARLFREGSEHVVLIEETKDTINGRGSNAGVCTPFINVIGFNATNRRTWQHEFGETSWGTNRESHRGRFQRMRGSRIFNLQQRRNQDFSGGVDNTSEENWNGGPRIEKKSYYGKLEYTYEANFGKPKKLAKQYKKFIKTTGLDDACVEINKRDRKKLRYHRLIHKMEFSEDFIKGFANIDEIDSTLDYFKYEIEGIASMMADDGRKEFCGSARRHKKCRKKLTRKAKKAWKKLTKDVKKFARGNSDRDFAKAFSRLAKNVVKNPVLYRMMYEEVKKCGMKSTFEISGETITRIYKVEEYENSDYCYLSNL